MKKLFYVAIHVLDYEQALREAEKCVRGGADGVFLVNNGLHVSGTRLFDLVLDIRRELSDPGFFIGVNPIDFSTEDALEFTISRKGILNALWVDDGGIVEEGNRVVIPQTTIELLADLKATGIQYFGGIAFKYQPQVQDLVAVSGIAAKYFDVVVTSGEKTGSPPPMEKIMTVHRSIIHTGKPLAIASGISIKNIEMYEEANIIIIGTSVWKDPKNEFENDEKKIREIAKFCSSVRA